MSDSFALACDARTELGESPLWSVAEQALYFVDIKGCRLHRFDPRSAEQRHVDLPEQIGCVGLARSGGFVAGLRSGIWRLDPAAKPVALLAANPENTATSRFNDGRVDPRGRFFAGTIDEPQAGGQAGLYRYDARGLVRLAAGLMTANGLAFSPDARRVYFSDTPRFVIYACDYDAASGEVGAARVFVRLSPTATDRGRPDGAAVDAEGCYWTALFEGGRVQRYSPQGELLAEYPLPARRPTMPAFGDPDLKTLFVTSARDPHDGSGGQVYSMRVTTPGLPGFLFDA